MFNEVHYWYEHLLNHIEKNNWKLKK
jgi:hypothetical protein